MNISGAKNAYFIFDDFIVRTGHQVVQQVKVQAVPSVYNSDVFSFRIIMNRGLNYEKYFFQQKSYIPCSLTDSIAALSPHRNKQTLMYLPKVLPQQKDILTDKNLNLIE